MASSPSHAESHLEPDAAESEELSIETRPDSRGADSAILDGNSSTYTASSDVYRFETKNGRTYQTNDYPLPNDEAEQARLDLTHEMWRLTFPDSLTLNPGKKPARVLDIGTGTGIWAIDFADAHPEAEVIGVDISPIQPAFVPPNCRFEIDDVEKDWNYSQNFDLVVCRSLIGSIEDWSRLFQQAYKFLQPGGWIEVLDHQYPLKAQSANFENTHLSKWSSFMIEATNKLGRPITVAPEFQELLRTTGFQDVGGKTQIVPIGGWAKDSQPKAIGQVAGMMFDENVEGISQQLFSKVLGWSDAEVLTFSAAVRNDIRTPGIYSFSKAYAAWGQKPLDA